MRVCIGVLLFALSAHPAGIAQQPSTPSPTFEVASVKRNVSGRIGGAIRVSPAGGALSTWTGQSSMPLVCQGTTSGS